MPRHYRRATTRKTSEHLRRGDVVLIRGLGAFTINGFRKIGPGEVLVKLSWGELALVAYPGQTWEVYAAPTTPLVPVPELLPGDDQEAAK